MSFRRKSSSWETSEVSTVQQRESARARERFSSGDANAKATPGVI